VGTEENGTPPGRKKLKVNYLSIFAPLAKPGTRHIDPSSGSQGSGWSGTTYEKKIARVRDLVRTAGNSRADKLQTTGREPANPVTWHELILPAAERTD
jgi:hypothetical protein